MNYADLSDVQALALSFARSETRPVMSGLLALEAKLGWIIAAGKEPALVQIRLAWWRDQVQCLGARAHADPLLRQLATNWTGQGRALCAVIDGWEALLDDTAGPDALRQSLEQRAAGYVGAAHLLGCGEAAADVTDTVRWWLAAETLRHVRHPGTKAHLLHLARNWPRRMPRLPAALRPLLILAVLGQKSLLRGGTPMLSRRSDALAAWRAGVLGR